MHDYKIWLDGESNEVAGIILKNPLIISEPVPKIRQEKVAGKNGDLIFWDGSYENRSAKTDVYIFQMDYVKEKFGRVHNWLFKNGMKYRRIETNDDPTHFMLGRLVNGASIETRIRRIAPFSLKFDCKPQRFLKSGEQKHTFDSMGTIENPTIFTALPKYRIYGNGKGFVRIGNNVLDIFKIENYFDYDAEIFEATKNNESWNLNVKGWSGLPIEKGEQIVTFSGGITAVEIMPRWWEL